MLERPTLSDEAISRYLQDNYGISASRIAFLPIGYDSTASVFRVDDTDGQRYFLKAKSVPVAEATLAIPHFLRRSGVEEIVAPLPTGTHALSAPLGDGFTGILYPFVQGRVGMDGGLSAAQWAALGHALHRIHAAVLPVNLSAVLRRETFVPLKGELAWALHRELPSRVDTHPARQELAVFWRERRGEIEAILRRAEELGRLAQARQTPFVLCHADIHIFNVLVDPAGGIHIVDWDETILAPKERDLMFILEGAVAGSGVALANEQEAAFLQGYGPTEPDPVILAYYRYEWVVQEIAEFGKQVFWSEDGGEVTRWDGARHFRGLFQPGDVVESAYRSEARLVTKPV